MTSSTDVKNTGFIGNIERIGNIIPNITMLFIYALLVCMVLSFGLSFFTFDYVHPVTHEPIVVNNLLERDRLMALVLSMVKNFVNYPPLGIVVVATLGIGIANGSGYINTLIRKMLQLISSTYLTPSIAFIGVVSHVVADSAYVVIMPVAAMMFYASGRHPLAGIATVFAGLAGGFTASVTPSLIDPIMQSFTQDAAHIIDPSYDVNVLCNYFVGFGGAFIVVLIVWYITDRVVEPRLVRTHPVDTHLSAQTLERKDVTPRERRAFRLANVVILVFLIGLVVLAFPSNSILRAPDGSLTSHKAPLMQAIVPLIFMSFTLPGLVYGYFSGTFTSSNDVTAAMEKVVTSLVGFLVFAFFSGQFLYAFKTSNLGTLIALSGADFLKALHMPSGFTVLGIIFLTGLLNVIITSASSKWAILAPIFVPMLMAVGISPELTQAAFRVSDSAVNVSTPMFAFYPLIILYCQEYVKQTGVGTLVSMMVPYSIGLLLSLSAVLFVFWGLGIPLGFDAGYVYPPM